MYQTCVKLHGTIPYALGLRNSKMALHAYITNLRITSNLRI